MTITPEILVNREVHYCVSHLVSTLAQGGVTGIGQGGRDLADMIDQAFELCSPIDDWEEAATQAGWTWNDEAGAFNKGADETWLFDTADWRSVCEADDIEPYQREVFEHWIVSDWLADRLAEHGEKVDKDFAGLTVWARTTTGQGIASDSVIERICADLNREV